jgi:hypothetical protein
MISAGVSLMQSPAVNRFLESEAFGTVVEKAMSVPIKVSGALAGQKERVVTLFELATQKDIDDLKQSVTRMEDVLREIKEQSSELLKGVENKAPVKPKVSD